MKIAHGDTDQGIVIGNAYDKYQASNPIVRWIMRGFECALEGLVEEVEPTTIHEIGCGEGYWTLRWRLAGRAARGSDFSQKVVEIARQNAHEHGLTEDFFQVRSIYELTPIDGADLLSCCEVLEHLDDPVAALRALRGVPFRHLILSVPQEPLWRVLTLARGRYVSVWGNTPGHLQHWSTTSFVSLVSEHFEVLRVCRPLPWSMLLCRPKTG